MSTMDNLDAEGFCRELGSCLKVRGWTWRRLSAHTGVSSSTLTRLKAGRRPDAASLAALSAWAGLNPSDFHIKEPLQPTPRFTADSLAGTISALVKASVQGDGEQYAMHEAALRKQLGALERELQAASRIVRVR